MPSRSILGVFTNYLYHVHAFGNGYLRICDGQNYLCQNYILPIRALLADMKEFIFDGLMLEVRNPPQKTKRSLEKEKTPQKLTPKVCRGNKLNTRRHKQRLYHVQHVIRKYYKA